jgi:hypothetical protein
MTEHEGMPEPTIVTELATAWRLSTVVDRAVVGCWLLESKRFHRFWSRWVLYAVHLRPEEGMSPPELENPDATHQIVISSLNPEFEPNYKQLLPDGGWAFLSPPDLVKQFNVPGDAAAASILEQMVDLITSGKSSPDSDYRQLWSDYIDRMASRYRSGFTGIA